ncbi:sodium-dependent glucose transporter 1A-like protein [Dinothrombium tinctorium]|uniref:Sodium-dependent glucose transporter 1A-like protein n=1 Tax=Dinothrombium tinctorium TaxID=1965070 RepID=A0A3S3P7S1_9ACAR|nr:sodium-dependent glucose transporter 1A-like protein [Dinothrombium tinctorium]
MLILEDIKNNKVKFLKTVFASLIYLIDGLATAIIGPTLLDLQIAVNSSLEKVGYLLPVRAFGYFIGAVFGTLIPNKSDRQPYLIVCSLVVAILVTLISLNRNLWTIIINVLLSGIFTGLIEIC